MKHWAFNDPPKRLAPYIDAPPPPEEYMKLKTRVTDLHPMTVIQNARTSGGGQISLVPTRAATVGPFETWKSEKVSIWQAGTHDNPFGMRLTAWMISKQIADSSVPMSLLGRHPNVQFNYYRPGLGTVATLDALNRVSYCPFTSAENRNSTLSASVAATASFNSSRAP